MPIFSENQPIIFDNEAVARCAALDWTQPVDFTDVTSFQFLLENCSDATNLFPGFQTSYFNYPASSFVGDDASGCMDGAGAFGALIRWSVLTPGTYYVVNFTVTDLVGELQVSFGSLVKTITGNGTFQAFGFATAATLQFYITADSYCCLSDVTAFELDLNYDFSIRDANGTEVATFSYGDTTLDGEDYVVLDEGYMNVDVYWDDLGVDTCGCYTITVIEPCDLDESTSQPLRLCNFLADTILINACNDTDALGMNFTSGFTPKIRLDAALLKAQYGWERNTEENTDGRVRNTFFQRRKKKTLMVNPVPEYVHDFLSLLGGFDHWYIDGVEYVVEEESEYLVQYPNGDDYLGSVKLDVRIKEELTINKVCAEEGDGCLIGDGNYLLLESGTAVYATEPDEAIILE